MGQTKGSGCGCGGGGERREGESLAFKDTPFRKRILINSYIPRKAGLRGSVLW